MTPEFIRTNTKPRTLLPSKQQNKTNKTMTTTMTIDYGNKHHQKAMTFAAGHFLSEVPGTWEELHALLQALDEAQNEDHPILPDNYTPWEAVEDYRPEEVYDLIENLATDFLLFGEP